MSTFQYIDIHRRYRHRNLLRYRQIPIRRFIQYRIARYGLRWYRVPSLATILAKNARPPTPVKGQTSFTLGYSCLSALVAQLRVRPAHAPFARAARRTHRAQRPALRHNRRETRETMVGLKKTARETMVCIEKTAMQHTRGK